MATASYVENVERKLDTQRRIEITKDATARARLDGQSECDYDENKVRGIYPPVNEKCTKGYYFGRQHGNDSKDNRKAAGSEAKFYDNATCYV